MLQQHRLQYTVGIIKRYKSLNMHYIMRLIFFLVYMRKLLYSHNDRAQVLIVIKVFKKTSTDQIIK